MKTEHNYPKFKIGTRGEPFLKSRYILLLLKFLNISKLHLSRAIETR